MHQGAVAHPQSAEDWRRVRDLCCLTGAAGEPIAAERWPFFGEFWIGPYQRLVPEWAYVLRDGSSEIRGYLTGAPDTRRFERRKRLLFSPVLALRLLTGKYPWNADAQRFMKRELGLERAPAQCFSASLQETLNSQFPAHLHINLDAQSRGKGYGQLLIDHYISDLRKQSVRGVHVFCGTGPVPFYQRVGFRVLERIEFKTAQNATPADVFALGLVIQA